MCAIASIFFDVELPNPPTWFYFSVLLATALFVKFSRLLSMRNWDVLTLFLFAPGFLLLREDGRNVWGFPWLVCVSAYFLLRCLADLILVRRPALSPNLNLSGLACLGGAMFLSLAAVAVQQPVDTSEADDAATSPVDALRVKGLPRATGEPDGPPLRVAAARGLALLCHLSIVVGLVLVGWRCFEDVHAGMAAATFYLLLPYTYLLTPHSALGIGRWDHLWPMAWMIWAVFAYRKPTLAAVFFGVATGGVLFPALALPVWLSFYWRRGAARFGLIYLVSAGLTLALIGVGLWAFRGQAEGQQAADALARWQPWSAPPADARGVWQGVYWVYRLPVFIAYAAFVITTLFWPVPKNLAHVLALTAALFLGIQFWCAENGGAYVLWYLPLLLLLVFRPNLTGSRPPPCRADWLVRLWHWLWRRGRRLFGRPEPAAAGSSTPLSPAPGEG